MPSRNPVVSIIIPVVNNLQYNRECLESIEKHTGDVDYEIIVVDNSSTDGSREYFQSLGGKVRVLCNDHVKTFAQSNNQAAREARGEYLIFLNNDTHVTQSWLSPLLDCMRSDPSIGMVGNKHLFPINHLVSHVGGVFAENGPEHIYLHYDPNLPFLNVDREYQWVTAACVLVSKKVFFEIDGFCEEYKNSYEDVDLCLKARAKGYKILYCHKSVIYHHGLRTPGREDNESGNRSLFKSRWDGKIRLDREEYFKKDNIPDSLSPDHRLERTLFQLEFLLLQKEKQIDGLKKHIEAIHNTFSWRITKPVRRIKQLFAKHLAI